MSKLAVAPELLVQAIFEGAQPDLRIRGASFDPQRQIVLLDVEGPGVPEAEEVVAVCRFDPQHQIVLLDVEGPGVPEAEEVVAVCHRQPPLRVEFQAR